MDTKEIIKLGEKASSKLGLSLATIGMKAVGNARIFERLQAGGGCNIRTYSALEKWLRQELKR